ncbi:MAG: pyridoxal 5'-phosphate synthase glutaminase subunit PdxT [Candidatus Thermofonsia Clade 1 bacterium]|uniref:Pyridoxal 5'-phosphate synthase subunit PdxT n=1 Tax=Candidatus Thermofonsia Clade 1 bacterium TaxID=2364210 RepID=A0A2M8PGX9_9CHLR|nr:MAG: pyridoxal 5'-phosphate synthase glutaminase subunit PdxT [Candidatus Thermofonsia Clade 1 bacterium]RMF54161.1 MAG: pyridoxal 5'-phosphate synthase glutaminase subunit PdxT [Chloroflexota bacterium]
MNIGVLALQGDFAEHAAMLRQIGANPIEVRKAEQLADLHGLIIPGGESTTISRVARASGLYEPLREFAARKPTWGTCAGAILLAKRVTGQEAHLGVMDIAVTRNAFGRQIDSFSTELLVEGFERPLRAVFIRAPIIESVGAGVRVLARLPDGRIVAAQQGHLLATAFHPELTPDTRLHTYFLDICHQQRVMA